jgi:uncharacterized RDD family membrane protein YckC
VTRQTTARPVVPQQATQPRPRPATETAAAEPTATDTAAAEPAAAEPTATETTAAQPAAATAAADAAAVPRHAPDRQATARPWRRLVGYLIDCLVIGLITGALWVRLIISVTLRIGNVTRAFPGGGSAAMAGYGRVLATAAPVIAIELVTTMCLAIAYYWVLTGYWGTTIGKRSVGTWVVSADDGSPVSRGRALVRALVFVAGWVVWPFFLIDNLWLVWGRRRQCLHDKAARTVVVRTRRSSSSRCTTT